MNISYKLISSLSFEKAHDLFNRGFEGYIMPMNLSLDTFVGRFGNDGLSPALSVVAYDGADPIGFVLQGIREVDGQKISWNGGTGIIPEYRGRGLGYPLMEEAEKRLNECDVSIATLEALSENKPAISLYEKCGYKIEDELLFLRSNGVVNSQLPSLDGYEMIRIPSAQAIGSDLFPGIVPWQTDVSGTPKIGGEAVLITKNGAVQAACLIRKKSVFGNEAEGITLFQVKENGNEDAFNKLLAHALEYDQPITRTTYNFLKGDGRVVSSLVSNGFENTPVSQVFMTKTF
ncbi:GNAT family N-acetyltransferase [Sporosarcina thermotolerans]|uniref:GNAT family N-acetyltransferase n=1 Tax=Sporosarcina thermotolerans TaxID=633404 RepID=A0AAW9A7Y9_9BACL|nr:GNAT family N-acetyltransferase [Sporosarcina thermotolerans]MDW0117527.1 GNAT family N-acetyltransferase [Sporosarcina thermotolerans]